MRGPLLALIFAAFALAWLVFFGAGIRTSDVDSALLLLGATVLFYWTFRTGQMPPRLPLWQAAALWALPIYAIFQLIPLPPAILQSLSPARAVIAASLGGVLPASMSAPISVAPASALSGLFSLLGYLTIFGLLRDMGWRFVDSHPWLPVAPIAAIASIEALIGIGQWLGAAGHSNAIVMGTFSNAEHFSGLLEIALPFTLVYGFIAFRRHQSKESTSQMPAVLAAGAWTATLLLLLALAQSSSAASGVVVASSFLTLLGLILVPRLRTKKQRWYGAGLVACGALAAVLSLPPATYNEPSPRTEAASAPDARFSVWSSSVSLFGEFRWFGTGSGGFESTFLKYQGSQELNRVTDPGNDVLDLLIKFGTVGYLIVLIALAGILRPALFGAVFLSDEPRRLLAAAISASVLGMLLRSGLEATLSTPAIAMAFAWIAGLSQSSGLE